MLETHPARDAEHSPTSAIGLFIASCVVAGTLSWLVSKFFYADSWASSGRFLVWLVGFLLLAQVFPAIYYYRKNKQLTNQLRRLSEEGGAAPTRVRLPSRNLGALPPEPEDFKDFLASAPLEGIDLTRDRSLGRAVEL